MQVGANFDANVAMGAVLHTCQSSNNEETRKMNIKCPNCGMEYEVERKDFGSFVTCESCGKGFVVGAKSGARVGAASSASQTVGGQTSNSIATWVCVVILVLNLTALVTMCCLMHGGFGKIDVEMVKIHKSIDAMNEDLSGSASSLGKKIDEIHGALEQMDKSRHNDAEQIYDRMGRMKLY